MAEITSFADIPVDILRAILEQQSVVLSGRLSLASQFWRTFIWRRVVNTVAVWPTVDTVVKRRDADLMVSTIRAHSLSTSVREVRIYVNNGRRPDTCYMSMSPRACSELLVSCRETLRHLALAFAPQPSLKALTPEAFEMASSLRTLELVISEFTQDWCTQFLSRCSNVEKLVLTFLREDIPSISADFLATACPNLRDLSILCPGDTWVRFKTLKTLLKFTIRYVTETEVSYHGWWGDQSFARVLKDVQAPLAIKSCLVASDALSAIKELTSWMPQSVGMDWAIQITYSNLPVWGRSPTISFSPLVILALSEHQQRGSTISALEYIVQNSKGGKLANQIDVFFNVPQCGGPIPIETLILQLVLRDLLQQPPNVVERRVSDFLIPILDRLQKVAELDFTRPLRLKAYLDIWHKLESSFGDRSTLPLNVTEFWTVELDDQSNLFYVSCQYDILMELAQHLLTSGLLQQLKSAGQANRALIGPGRKTLLMAAAASSPMTLKYLCNNLDLLINEPEFERRPLALLFAPSNLMNARDISGRTLLHHIPQEAPRRRRHFGSDYAPPQFDLKQLIAAGADPFFWSQDMMTVPPPISVVGLSTGLMSAIPPNTRLCIPGVVQCLVMLLRSRNSLSTIEATLKSIKHLWKEIAEYRNPLNGLTLFHVCCHCGENYAGAVQSLLNGFIDVDSPSPLGTPLFFARLANPKAQAYALLYRDEPDGMKENLVDIFIDGTWVTEDIVEAARQSQTPTIKPTDAL